MNIEPELCYQALLTHDPRFDGVFFVGVATTGIYCRTVCTARTPRPENCAFYPSAAAAERAGYRPCLRCRPELAPGNARVDAAGRLAAAVASRIEDGVLAEASLEDLAAEFGVTDRHLRRVVREEYGVSPIELAQTQRLLLAKRLLTDTDLPVIEVAFASGFASLRRFNALFKARYQLRPTDLRRGRAPDALRETLVCELAYRPPFAWDALLQFLGDRALLGVDATDGTRYLRTVALGERRGWIAVSPVAARNALRVECSASLAPTLSFALARVKRLFDLSAEPAQIAAHLGALATAHPGLRVPGAFDGFEAAVRAILGQQISVRAATTLAGRFATAFGEPIETPFPQLTHTWATPAQISAAEPEELTRLGVTAARARTILSLARALQAGTLTLEPGRNVERTITRLKELPGIGDWTAQYIAMRALSYPDAFPASDLGVMKALGETDPKRVMERAQAWRPWRAYAVLHLWKSLEENAT